ncbi:hypothetical protein GE061_020288 [Apolygus lucorum]|uniref:Uncharacterized protein n=1 Tax=Apolygus lucorum TaxID=248454 RepID=A0A8S9WJK8_APOLU|nr:hypothetical protein GE061_020288 [Apolygus lucorum]
MATVDAVLDKMRDLTSYGGGSSLAIPPPEVNSTSPPPNMGFYVRGLCYPPSRVSRGRIQQAINRNTPEVEQRLRMGDRANGQGGEMKDASSMTSENNETPIGLSELVHLPAYRTYMRYIPYMDFCRKMAKLEKRLEKILDLESTTCSGAHLVRTSTGRHFNNCSWVAADGDDKGVYDVVESTISRHVFIT